MKLEDFEMGRNGMSDLELELERDSVLVYDETSDDEQSDEEDGLDTELEDDEAFTGALDDAETDDGETDDGETDDHELEEDEADDELVEPDVRGFGERFHELSLRESESELELELEVNSILRDMEREYFLKGLLKKVVAPGAKALFRKGLAYAKKATPLGQVINAATALSKGNMRGLLSSLANAGLSLASKYPGFAAVMPALGALGFKPGQPGSKLPWQNLAALAKDAYSTLARNLTSDADQPAQAAEIAHRSFKSAVARATKRGSALRTARDHRSGHLEGKARVVTLKRGQRLVIRCI